MQNLVHSARKNTLLINSSQKKTSARHKSGACSLKHDCWRNMLRVYFGWYLLQIYRNSQIARSPDHLFFYGFFRFYFYLFPGFSDLSGFFEIQFPFFSVCIVIASSCFSGIFRLPGITRFSGIFCFFGIVLFSAISLFIDLDFNLTIFLTYNKFILLSETVIIKKQEFTSHVLVCKTIKLIYLQKKWFHSPHNYLNDLKNVIFIFQNIFILEWVHNQNMTKI